MSQLNGPHHYYTPGIKEPHVVEIDGDRVWLAGDDQPMRLDKCTGRFVRLVEVRESIVTPIVSHEETC